MSNWTPDSWRAKEIFQQPKWPVDKLEETCAKLAKLPPLVFAGEIESLKEQLAAASRGEAFLLQGGDCAEDFSSCNATYIRETMKVLLQMAVVLTFGANKNVVKIGRIAGQYAKPRSSDTEMVNGVELPSYRGDCVNSPEATLEARTPNPDRLLEAYFHSTATLNLLRAYVQGGYADLHKVHVWNKEFVANSSEGQRYESMAAKIDSAISFMEACGVNSTQVPQLKRTNIYTSHEALILPFEQAMTRKDTLSGRWYDCSAHMVWIGDRTRQIDAAHMEFFRGINNPVGMKVGPTMNPDELIKILDILNPNNEEGRINLISRFGHGKIGSMLAPLVKRVRDEGRNVLWSCDPMHGNTFTADSGFKTRDFQFITDEIKGFFDTHGEAGTVPGGLHFELTGANVTEICGGAQKISDLDLGNNYQTNCDPRLNCQQSLELAYDIAEMLQK
jgi:3-deoxy-7-phosphoheptulonate synthase